MGASISLTEKVHPQELQKFQISSRTSSQESDAVYPAKSRHCTDVCFLILMAVFFFVLGVLAVYCVIYGNIYRLLNGYDNCADVCGIQNYREKDLRFECKGIDLRNDRYLMILNASESLGTANNVRRKCVTSCDKYPGYRQIFNRCILEKNSLVVNRFISKLGWNDFFQEAAEDLANSWQEILYLCFIGLGFCVVLVLLLRFFVGFLVWTVVIGVSLASIIGTAYLWTLYIQIDSDINSRPSEMTSTVESTNKWSILVFGVIVSAITFCIIVIVVALRSRIKLVVQLFVEAGKALSSMPLLLLQPIVTLVSLLIVIGCWLYLALWIQSAGHLTYISEEFFLYVADAPMKTARFWNFFSMLWMCQFIIGCQHMILAGAVATWYFSRDKSKLGDPILYSHYNLIKYHLGSVCLGSFLIATVQLLRFLLTLLQKYFKNKTDSCTQCALKCCQCCLFCLEKVLKYISRNTYIEIAMHGQNFCTSGKAAFKILVTNSLRVTVINSVGDFVLLLSKVLVVIATVFIGIEIFEHKEGIQHIWVPLLLVATFTYFVANCFITVYEMAIDTIFLCFCKDCEQNNGLSRPYFMSKGLMSFVQNSKKLMEKTSYETWAQSPNNVSTRI